MTKYRTIVADPPWPLRWSGGGSMRANGRGERHTNVGGQHRALPYPAMSIEQIAALQVAPVADDDAHLFLWIPDRFLVEGVGALVVRAWGFEPPTTHHLAQAGFRARDVSAPTARSPDRLQPAH